jgi:hypothetical protein
VAVGLSARSDLWSVGTGDFLHALFSTVSASLEPDGWGTRLPTVLGPPYEPQLAEHPPSDVVWDVEDRSQQPPRGENISPDITSLAMRVRSA